MSGEKRVTCSAIKPLLKVMDDKMVTPTDADSTLTCEIKSRIKNDLEGQYASTELNLLFTYFSFQQKVCTFLHNTIYRGREFIFECYFNFFS